MTDLRTAALRALEALEGFVRFAAIHSDGPDASDKYLAEDYAEEAFLKTAKVLPDLRVALEQPVQEPVAIVSSVTEPGQYGVKVRWLGGFPQIAMKLYTHPPQPPQPAQEPKERWCSACGYVSTRCLGDEQSCVWNWSAIRAALPHRPAAPIIKPEIKADKETRWLPMPWKGLTEEEHNYYKALGFVGVKAVEEKLRAKNSTLACIPAVPPG